MRKAGTEVEVGKEGKRDPHRLTVRVAASELATIAERAGRARLSASRYLAECALRGKLPPMREALPASTQDRAQIEGLMAELRKVGVNLNQLARRRNRARFGIAPAPSLTEVERAAGLAGRLLVLLRNRL